MKRKVLTLCIVRNGTRVLLGLKKRGFGQGKWNGFGGKVEPLETIEEATVRELTEEACVVANAHDLKKHGVLEFRFVGKDEVLEVHIFSVYTITGIPQETPEMRPAWFEVENIPYESMWSDDTHWLPLLLDDQTFTGSFLFDETNEIIEYTLQAT